MKIFKLVTGPMEAKDSLKKRVVTIRAVAKECFMVEASLGRRITEDARDRVGF